MIGRLALALERSGVDLDPVRLAEILWVATHGHGAGWAEGESPQPIRDDDEERGPDDDAAGQPAALEPEETPAAPTDTRAPLYLVPRPAVPDEESQRPAVEVRLPGPAALPGRLQLGRALRVLKRERPVSRVGTLDLDATIKQYGDTGLLTPLMRPAAERWFDVALVVDGGATMDVWAQTTVELTKLLESHGAFRRVRRWRLVEQSGEPWLLNDAGARHHLRQLAEPEGRQVTMVVTDCVGAQWYSSPIWSAIQDWGRHGPVVLVQPLPPRLWESTALGPVDVRLTGYRPGQPNRGLRITLPWWWMAEERPAGAVPVIALTEPDVSRWARMVMGAAGVPVLGVIAEAGPPVDLDDVPAAEPNPAARVASFRSTVSPEAYQLAVCLAAVPVRLPIARIVQYGVLGSHDLVHLAEVFASGLLRRVTPPGANVPIDDVEYAFVAGVREILQQSLTGVRTLEIFRSVARYLEAILGRPANFTALLTAAPDADSIDEDFQPFAEIAAHLIDLLDLGQDLVAAAATSPPPPEPQRTDPLPWGHAILVGTDKQIDQFEQWLISPRGGGLPPERVFVAASPESLPHALRDAAGAASAEGRQPGVLFLLEYGPFDQNPEFEEEPSGAPSPVSRESRWQPVRQLYRWSVRRLRFDMLTRSSPRATSQSWMSSMRCPAGPKMTMALLPLFPWDIT